MLNIHVYFLIFCLFGDYGGTQNILLAWLSQNTPGSNQGDSWCCRDLNPDPMLQSKHLQTLLSFWSSRILALISM